MKTEHILIIRFSALGDVAMMVPVVSSLARQYPHVRVTVLSRPFARPFFEGLAPNVHFMSADLKNEYHGVKGLNNLYRRLIAKKFTAIADFHNVLRTKYLRMRYSMAGYHVAHINKHRTEKHRLTSEHNKQLKPLQTSFQNYADVLKKLGYPIHLDFDKITVDAAPVFERLNTDGKHEPWIGIAPFAAHRGKIYPLEKMETVISQLVSQKPTARFFLFGGGQKEMEVFERWKQKYPRITIAGTLFKGLGEELLLMSQLDVMLSMDSANMHLASMMGTRVVSIWGATHPYAGFMGWNQKEEDAVQLPLDCRPCSIYGGKKCFRGDYACLNNIPPENIVERI